MLFGLKNMINNDNKIIGALEAAATMLVEDDSDDIKDAFLDDPETMMIGAENDPEIAKLVDAIPDDVVDEVDDVSEKDIEKITEEFVPESIIQEGDHLEDTMKNPAIGQPEEDTDVISTPADEQFGIDPNDVEHVIDPLTEDNDSLSFDDDESDDDSEDDPIVNEADHLEDTLDDPAIGQPEEDTDVISTPIDPDEEDFDI